VESPFIIAVPGPKAAKSRVTQPFPLVVLLISLWKISKSALDTPAIPILWETFLAALDLVKLAALPLS
jgi:hypothetical protein